MSNKTAKLNELSEMVRVEKIRIANLTVAELRAGTFDIEAGDAVQVLEIAQEHFDYEVYYEQECRSEAQYSWEGLWTSRDEARVEQLHSDLDLIANALKEANKAFDAKIPF